VSSENCTDRISGIGDVNFSLLGPTFQALGEIGKFFEPGGIVLYFWHDSEQF
jgi:hypothetical protein